MQRFNEENLRLVNENTILLDRLHKAEAAAVAAETYKRMPIPEHSGGTIRPSEMVPKGSGAY